MTKFVFFRLSYYVIRYYALTFLTVVISFVGLWLPLNAWPARVSKHHKGTQTEAGFLHFYRANPFFRFQTIWMCSSSICNFSFSWKGKIKKLTDYQLGILLNVYLSYEAKSPRKPIAQSEKTHSNWLESKTAFKNVQKSGFILRHCFIQHCEN